MNSKLWVAAVLGLGLMACAPETNVTPGGLSGAGATAGSSAGSGAVGGTGGFGGTGGTGGFAAIGGSGGTGGVGTGGDCKAGHYIGEFAGKYRSTAWGNGEDANALDVSSTDDPIAMTVGLEFWLEATGVQCAPGEEFCGGFTINGGKMRGNALAGFISVPFEIDLTGDLDCRTGEFRGQLTNGWYDVAGARATFAGDIIADYDSTNSRFVNGTWDVVEDVQPNLPWPPGTNIGGEGTWSAGWVAN